jgi:hypothetical protein
MAQDQSSVGAGWIMFAGVVMVIVGVFQAIAGLAGIIEDEFYVLGREYIFEFDATVWGWIHLIIGLVVLLAGFGVFSGNVLARTVGVIMAGLSMVAAFLWLPWYPVWAIVIIAIDIAVIWALTVHGRALANAEYA